MRKRLVLCSIVCAMAFCGCGGTENPDKPVKGGFADPAFEAYLRSALGNMGGELTEGELGAIRTIVIDDLGCALSIGYGEEADITVPYQYVETGYSTTMPIYIQSLEDLEKLPNLENIHIGPKNVKIKNLNFVKSLPNLKSLRGDCSAPTLAPLANCASLESLDLRLDSNAEDLSPIGKCTALESLSLVCGQDTDLSPLGDCKKMREFSIDFWYTEEADISVLKNFTELENFSLVIPDNIQIDLTPMKYCTKLKVFYFLDTPFESEDYDTPTDLTPLKECKDLEEITIWAEDIENLETLLELPNLEHVFMHRSDERKEVIQRLEAKGVII